MNLQMMYPDPPYSSTIGGISCSSNSNNENENRMKLSKNEDTANKERMSVFDATTVTSKGLPMISSDAPLQEDELSKWIHHGLAFELDCLERLSGAVSNKASRHKHEGEALINVAAIHRKALAFDEESRKTSSDHSNKENTVNGSHNDSKKKKTKTKTHRSHNSNKENTNTANGQAEKLLIRLPFVDWKATLSKAKAVHDGGSRGEAIDTGGIGRLVSEIVEGWLIVLARLDQPTPSPSSVSLPFSFVVFSSATSYRSQIYRRLTLLLVGFVGLVGPSRAPSDDRSLTDNETKYLTMASEEATRIVEHTQDLARKILKEEGSAMKKKHNKSFVNRTNTSNNCYSHPSSLRACESRRSIETDGIYFYCWFTAVAAECGECLGDLDTALLAYKSIRAMEDRLWQNNADAGSTGVYACRNQSGEGAENKIENELRIDGRALEESIACTISKGSDNFEPHGKGGNSQITVTKISANTPNSMASKKHANNNNSSSSNDAAGSGWMAMAIKNRHASSSANASVNANTNHPIAIRRSRKVLSGPRVAPVGLLLLSPDSDLVVRGSRDANVLRNTKRSSCNSDSKIGNRLVPSGTLEERIRRCSCRHC